MTVIELRINEIAQGFLTGEQGNLWFSNLNAAAKSETLRSLSRFVVQSHPTNDEVSRAIFESGLNPNFTPCVLISKLELKSALHKINLLPDIEMDKSWYLLISLFAISDSRRRSVSCVNGCKHWWHNLKSV
ncbi:DUF5958 family protein [Enterovibrio calviensis]|uniref:DUF5958 family protein n=1 Tax=Enterovibrio calviensis TaxID=91359 RepID=UPI00373570A4